MFETQEQLEKSESSLLAAAPPATRQHRLMAAALVLLIVALAIVIYRGLAAGPDEEADDEQPADVTPTTSTNAPLPSKAAPMATVKPHPVAKKNDSVATTNPPADPPPVTTVRTVLPPLEVEVVAGDNHRTVRPGSNSVRLDLQQGVPPKQTTEPTTTVPDTAAANTHDASEKVEMSAGSEQLVVHTVRPDYPLLARQAKVQGSVILQALIGRDGVIQNLRVVGGPPILASAAEDAVRQWRFKPHVVGQEPVETQAKITVNFTISTN